MSSTGNTATERTTSIWPSTSRAGASSQRRRRAPGTRSGTGGVGGEEGPGSHRQHLQRTSMPNTVVSSNRW